MKPLILVVDDDERSRKLACELIAVNGFNVAEAADGEECLLLVAIKRPDVILLDMQMPRLDGIKTMKRLKGNPDTEAIPIVMLSASAMAEEKEAMRAGGCVAILSKPVDLKELIETIKKTLNAEKEG